MVANTLLLVDFDDEMLTEIFDSAVEDAITAARLRK